MVELFLIFSLHSYNKHTCTCLFKKISYFLTCHNTDSELILEEIFKGSLPFLSSSFFKWRIGPVKISDLPAQNLIVSPYGHNYIIHIYVYFSIIS